MSSKSKFVTTPGRLDAMVADHLTSSTSTSSTSKSHDPKALGRHGTAALEKHLDAVREKVRRIAESQKTQGHR